MSFGLVALLGTASQAALAPASVSGQAQSSFSAGKSRTTGQTSSRRRSNKPRPQSPGNLPDYVIGGNALSLHMPVQFGLVSYLPRVRVGVQYDYQLRRHHWLYVQAAGLFDRGNWKTFRLDDCGLEGISGACGKGGVAGFELAAGYVHKFYLEELPFLVPLAHGGLGYALWGYPKIGGGREQERVRSTTLHVRAGGGVRFFFLRELAVGADLNLKIGFERHLDAPLQNGSVPADRRRSTSFLLGLEVLPLLVEYRF